MGHKCPSCKSELFTLMDIGYKVEFYCLECNKRVIAIRREFDDEIKGTVFENFEENSRKKYL